MRVGVISDAMHYRDQNGRLCVIGPLVRQFGEWANLFEEVVICAPFVDGEAPPATHAPYASSNIRLIPIRPAGGNTLRAKLRLLRELPAWRRALTHLLSEVDALHVRCPNNISILGLLTIARTHHHRQAVYTGSWIAYPGQSPTYRYQRWFLRHWFRGPVAVYGPLPSDPRHVVSSFSPSFTRAAWEAEAGHIDARLVRLESSARLNGVVRVVSVGALSRNKNHQLIIRAVRLARDRGGDVHLTIAGEGATRAELEALTRELELSDYVELAGAVSHERVFQIMRQADFMVLASRSEGYPKVIIEALAHGAIPIVSAIGLAEQLTEHGDRGRTFLPDNASEIAEHILALSDDTHEMGRLVRNGRAFSEGLTLESWREHLRRTLETFWGVSLPTGGYRNIAEDQ